MAEKIAVVPRDGEGDVYDGLCSCGYHTDKWPSAETAEARIRQHLNEHKTGETMQPIDEFRAEHGLVVISGVSGAKFPENAKILDDGE